MRFSQYNQSQTAYLRGCILLPVIYLFCAGVTLYSKQTNFCILLSLLAVAAFVIFFLSWRQEKERIIFMDESGISLTCKGTLEWAFSWAEIQRMCYCKPYRRKGVCFHPADPAKQNSAEKYEFHLNNTAKAALTRYCQLPIEK